MITEFTQNWGKKTLGGHTHTHTQLLVCTRNQEKGAMPPLETESDLPVSVQESSVEAWVNSLTSGQKPQRNTGSPINKKTGIKIY